MFTNVLVIILFSVTLSLYVKIVTYADSMTPQFACMSCMVKLHYR